MSEEPEENKSLDAEEKKKKKEEEKKRSERYHKSMIEAKLYAYKQRAERAGIPERYVGIGPKDFMNLLSDEYHKTEDERKHLASLIYKTPFEFAKIPFVLIDGGNMEARKRACYAIMYRLITCDNFGEIVDCSALAHKLNTFDPRDVSSGEGRIDYAQYLKEKGVLAINEFRSTHWKEHCDGGSYLDEIMDHRLNKLKPTIITFQEGIDSKTALKTAVVGNYVAGMYQKEIINPNPSKNYLRLRVKYLKDD
jgi:hypothetical protein